MGERCREVLVHPDSRAARDPAWHQALVWLQGAKGGPGWALQHWKRQGSSGGRQPGVICFLLSSLSTVWGLEGLPTLSPLPSHLPLPVQPMGVGVWLSPCTRIISSVMYIQTHTAAWEDKTRRRRLHSWPEGGYNQVIEPEPEPSWKGAVNGS